MNSKQLKLQPNRNKYTRRDLPHNKCPPHLEEALSSMYEPKNFKNHSNSSNSPNHPNVSLRPHKDSIHHLFKETKLPNILVLPTHMFPPPYLKFSMHVIINEEGKRNNLILRRLEILMVMLQQVAICLENLATFLIL